MSVHHVQPLTSNFVPKYFGCVAQVAVNIDLERCESSVINLDVNLDVNDDIISSRFNLPPQMSTKLGHSSALLAITIV